MWRFVLALVACSALDGAIIKGTVVENQSGKPIVLDGEQSTFLYVRLPRFASISGIIVDENDVGLPEHEVAAFRNTRPPRLMARAQADDRGIYRIFGLEPGNYLVRTIGRQYEDGGYLPTFFRETQRVEEAGFVE